MERREIEAVAQVLSDWNPLGAAANGIPDLDGYRTEAIDIISVLRVSAGSHPTEKIVREVLNQAFGLSLTLGECTVPAQKIRAALSQAC